VRHLWEKFCSAEVFVFSPREILSAEVFVFSLGERSLELLEIKVWDFDLWNFWREKDWGGV